MLSFRNFREVSVMICALLFGIAVYVLGATGLSIPLLGCVVAWMLAELIASQVVVRSPTNIWDLQRKLMQASSQQLPTTPTITRGSLTYYALTMEEMAETGLALTKWASTDKPQNAGPYPIHPALAAAVYQINGIQRRMEEDCIELRTMLERVPKNWSYSLSKADAEELLDGVVDTTVTIAGLGLSSGLPAAEGYEEVQASNWSKRNPTTGLIDLDPSGKWIKGTGYRPPNLQGVLEYQWRSERD